MTTRMIFFGLAVLIAFVAFSTPAAASDMTDTTDMAQAAALEQDKAAAAALLEKGDATQAYELYINLLRADPDDDIVVLGVARAAARARRWNQAVMAYETLLEKYPRDAGLYTELANVYMLLDDREAAERSMAMVRSLDGKSTRTDTDRILDILERRYGNFQFYGRIRTGIQYDSNANLGPASDDLDLGDWQVTVRDAGAKGSFGMNLSADMYLGKRFSRASPWWLVGDANVFWRGHANPDLYNTRSREAKWLRGSAGLRRSGTSTMAEIRMKAEIFDFHFYQNVSSYGPEGAFLWAVTPDRHLIVRGNLEKRSYSRDTPRNGLAGSAGLYGRFFFGAGRNELHLGGRYTAVGTEKRDYGHNGEEVTARLQFKLPRGFELAPSLSYTRLSYNGPATVLETEIRRDNRWRTGVGLTRRINTSWYMGVGYQYTNNRSTSSLYIYEQHLINTEIVWSF